MGFLLILKASIFIKVLIITILMDTFFGVLRALKYKKLNSCIGIDGMIRKSGMIFAEIFLYLIDYLTSFNLISFLPNTIRELVSLSKIGIGELFCILFICFESISILKNMSYCDLPIPQKLKKFIEKILLDFTSEIDKKEEK